MPDDDKRVSLTGVEVQQIIKTLLMVKSEIASVDKPVFLGMGKPSDAIDGVVVLLDGKLQASAPGARLT